MNSLKEETFVLENYDGSKAYHERTRYDVIDVPTLDGALIAAPNPSDIADLVDDSQIEEVFPLLIITNPQHGFEQALARRATPEEREKIYEFGNEYQADIESVGGLE